MLGLKYFEQNTSKNHKIHNRHYLAEREIVTFLNISELYGKKINFSDKKKQFLDLGCGDQHLRKSVEDRIMDYLGLDINVVNFEFVRLPRVKNSVDFIVSLAVIEHISNPDNFLNEIYRVLKPDGILYVSTPNWHYCYKAFYNDPTHVKPYNPLTLETILTMYGFKNPKTFPGLRCKPKWYYTGKNRFFKGNYLLPFRRETKYVPGFLKGKSTSIIALATK